MERRARFSFHGGHSGEFCLHARGTLEEVIRSALTRGLTHYGVSEHCPRFREVDLYPEERERGLTPADLAESFRVYALVRFPALRERFGKDIELLKGMEIEVVPPDDYARLMGELRASHGIEYVVGSVHHVRDIPIDGTREEWQRAAGAAGGEESLVLEYYEHLREMLDKVRPEVVAHLDLIKLNAPCAFEATGRIRRAILASLDAVATFGALLEVNGKAWAKGLSEPYPSRWILEEARLRGIPATVGDDSHGPGEVGRNLDRCRAALVEAGYSEVHALVRGPHGLVKRGFPLEEGD